MASRAAQFATVAFVVVVVLVVWLLLVVVKRAEDAHRVLAQNPSAICPVLPESIGANWKYLRGDDFAVCYMSDRGAHGEHIALEFGSGTLGDEEVKAGPVASEQIAGRVVDWYRSLNPAMGPYGREAVLHTHWPHSARVRVSVRATTEAELQASLSLVRALRFSPSGS